MKKIILFLIFSNLLFSKTYVYTGHYPVTEEPYYFGSATGMDVGPDGNLYIASATNRITVFTPEGKFLKAYYLYDDQKIWDKKIHIAAMAIGPLGDIYVLDVLNGIYKFDKNGNKVKLFYYFWGEGELETDAQGNVYFGAYWWIKGRENQAYPNIIKFDSDGNIVKEYYLGNYAVYDLSISSDGKIYVLFYSKISIYDQEGNLLKSKSIDEFPFPPAYQKSFGRMAFFGNNIFVDGVYELIDNSVSKIIILKLDTN